MSNNNVTLLNLQMTGFRNYREEDFLTLLELDNAGSVELHLPRRAVLNQSPHGALVTEYTRMALLGEKLSTLGPGFRFRAPATGGQEPYVFYVPAQDRAALAALLVVAQDLCALPYGTPCSYDREARALLRPGRFGDHPCCELLVMALQFLRMDEEASFLIPTDH